MKFKVMLGAMVVAILSFGTAPSAHAGYADYLRSLYNIACNGYSGDSSGYGYVPGWYNIDCECFPYQIAAAELYDQVESQCPILAPAPAGEAEYPCAFGHTAEQCAQCYDLFNQSGNAMQTALWMCGSTGF